MMEQKPRKLSDQVRDALRLKHYSIRTEKAYVDCVRRSIQFYHKRHPADIGAAGIEAFHTRLAVHKNIAASPRNQNLSAPLEEVATALRLALREILPVASLLLQNLGAQAIRLDAVRRRIFGVVLQAIALEDLGGVDLTVVGAGHQIGRGEGIPEDRQTAIPAPEVVEGGRDPVLRFAEEDSGGSLLPGRGGGCAAGAGDEQQSKQREEEAVHECAPFN